MASFGDGFSPMFFVFFVFVFGLVIVGAIYGYRAQKERIAAIQRFARKWGLRYTEKDAAFAKRYEPGFKTLRQGSGRYACNLMRGEHEGRNIAVFDHHYEIKSKDSSTTYLRTMLLVKLDVDLGVIEMRPEGWGDRLSAAFGFDDIDFESAEFSRRYHVQSEDKQLAYALFHPKMIEFLLSRPKDIRLATYGRHLLAWRKPSGQLNLRETAALIEETYDILELIPRFMQKDRSVN